MALFSSKLSLEYVELAVICSVNKKNTSIDLRRKKTAFIRDMFNFFFAMLSISSCLSHLRFTRQMVNA